MHGYAVRWKHATLVVLRVHLRLVCIFHGFDKDAIGFSTISKWIICEPAWYPKVLCTTEEHWYFWRVAFYQSTGHELGHQFDIAKPFGFAFRPKAQKRLFLWLREVKCDLYSKHFMAAQFDYCFETVLRAFDFKVGAYTKNSEAKKKRFTATHPSWEIRRKYMIGHDCIDKKIIDELAMLAECNDKAYIQKMYRAYGVQVSEE